MKHRHTAPAPAPAAPAAAPAPASDGQQWGYEVIIQRDGDETCFLIATDIISAATQASSASGGARVIGVRQLGPALS